MRADELEKKIQKNIKTNLSHKDLVNLCLAMKMQLTGRKTYLQDKLLDFVKTQSYNSLVNISNMIDEYMRASNATKVRQTTNLRPMENLRVENLNSFQDKLSDELLRKAPIDLENEIPLNCRTDLVVQSCTKYPNPFTSVPTAAGTGVNERAHQVRIPNILAGVPITTSPFYCCSICLHPLSLLVPTTFPNIAQNSRNMAKSEFSFILSENARKIIADNSFSVNNKTDYKWNVLLRFVSVDPIKGVPRPGEKITEYIPPYLTVNVNNQPQALWDILPSNCRTKEGKRHAKAVPISDKLSEKRVYAGFEQNVTVSWWQTPTVYLYYYMGIYLERKLTVQEIINLFVTNKHINNIPIEKTLELIKCKLGGFSNNITSDDDLVISNVLPISLSCPVGKSRIEIPLRTLTCQHLQCFDAHLFLLMNERRPVWKCPVCDSRAAPDDLFCDKFFQKILKHFKNDDEVTDVNVNPDHSFVAVKYKDRGDRERAAQSSNADKSDSLAVNSTADQDLIVLDSDEEAEAAEPTKKSAAPVKETAVESEKENDFRRKVSNSTSNLPVQIQICNDDSSGRPIERRITAQNNSVSKEATASAVSAVEKPSALPVIPAPIFTSLPTAVLHNMPIVDNFSHPQPTNVSKPSSTTASVATQPIISSPMTSSFSFFTAAQDSPSSPPRFSSPIINSSPLVTTSLPTSLSFVTNPSSRIVNSSTAAPIGTPIPVVAKSNNLPASSVPLKPPVGMPIPVAGNKSTPCVPHQIPTSINKPTPPTTSSKPVNNLMPPSIAYSKPVTYTPKQSTTSYADISSPARILHSQPKVTPGTQKLKDTHTTKPTAPVSSSTGPVPSSFQSSTLFSSRKSNVDSTPNTSNHNVIRSPVVVGNTQVDMNTAKNTSNNPSNSVIDDIYKKFGEFKKKEGSQSPEPIACPSISLVIPDKKDMQFATDVVTCLTTTPQNIVKKNDHKSNISKSKIPPPSNVVIPSVTIDLTEEEDEAVPQPSTLKPSGKPAILAKQMNSYNWKPVTAPISANLNGHYPFGLNKQNRFAHDKPNSNLGKRPSQPEINHYSVPARFKSKSSIPAPHKQQQAIDLTGEDDDEHSPAKRFKPNNISSPGYRNRDDTEDGQLMDSSDSTASSDSSDRHSPKKSNSATRNVLSRI